MPLEPVDKRVRSLYYIMQSIEVTYRDTAVAKICPHLPRATYRDVNAAYRATWAVEKG